MKKGIVLYIISLVTAFCFFMSSCSLFKSSEDRIIDRIEKFEDCYNNGDLDGILECMATKERKLIQAELNMFGMLMGGLVGVTLDLSDLFSLGVAMQDTEWIQVSVKEVRLTTPTTAIAEANVSFTQGAVMESSESWFYMVQEGDDWFIEDMVDPPEEESASDGSSALIGQ